jgi:hypothetical protein
LIFRLPQFSEIPAFAGTVAITSGCLTKRRRVNEVLAQEQSKSVVVPYFFKIDILSYFFSFGLGCFEFFIDIFFVYPEVLAVGLYTNAMGFG